MFSKKTQPTTSTEFRLIPYCDQIIIATLLVIIIAVPLYFDVHLHSVFDLSKITILYVLTFAILATWSIRTIITCEQETKGRETRDVSIIRRPSSLVSRLLSQPLCLPIIAFLFVSGLATIFSINPYLSLVGTYKRYGGFISTLVYISLFFIIVNFIDKRRLGSFLNVIISTACIASIYGIFQHFGLDLYHWSTSFGYRAASTFGHPAFFSAFLIMVIPLVLFKIFSNSNLRSSTFKAELSSCLYIGILALLIVAFYYTKTRASFLGLIISNLFFFSFIGKKNLLANKTKTVVTITIIIGISIFFNVNNKTSVIGRFVEDIKPSYLDNRSGEKTNSLKNKNLTEQVRPELTVEGQDLFTQPAPVDGLAKAELSSRLSLSQYHRLPARQRRSPAPVRTGTGGRQIRSGGDGSDEQDSDWEVDLARQIEGTNLTRFLQYLAGLRIIYDYPILGIGPDTLGMIYPQYIAKLYQEMNEHRVFENQNRIHNDLLDITVSMGLLGLGVYVWFAFAYARMVWKGCKKAEDSDKILIIGLCAGCLAYFIQNQFSFGHVPIITLFWFLIAMSVIACPPEPIRAGPQSNDIQNPLTHKPDLTRRNIGSPLERFGKHTLCGIVVCLMILLVTLSLYRYKADVYFEHGRRSLARPRQNGFVGLANGAAGQGKSEITEAIQSYEMAVKYNPLALDYRNVLNGIYLKMAIIGISKDSERITDDQTNIFSRRQTTMWFANAITGAEEVQKLYPRDYHSAFTLGQAYNLLDKMSDKDMSMEAIKYYKRAITLHPFEFKYRNKLAQLYAEKGRYEDAIHELKEAKCIDPSNQASYLNLAKVFMSDRERYEEAEAVLLEYIKGNPDREIIDIFRLLSYVYFKTSKWEEVLSQSKKIIQLDQEDLEAHKYAVMADFKLERYDDAQTLCNRILDLSGTQNNTHSKYAKEMLEILSEK